MKPQRAGDANGFLLYLINELVMIISFALLPCVSAIKHSAHVDLWGRRGGGGGGPATLQGGTRQRLFAKKGHNNNKEQL